ncbi:MAG: acetate--CoA ligase [Sterolibacterium sp.]|nr:acetate--CoA ligase [Sterolibacterium sp.]
MTTIQSVLQENRVFPPSAATVARATISGRAAYDALCQEARDDPDAYWARLAHEHLSWQQDFRQTLDESQAPFYRWFVDGRLNVSYNCLDRHVEAGLGEKTAIIFETDEGQVTTINYRELLRRTAQFANALKAQGIVKGDRVVIYMPMSIEAIVAMQACARIGATHSVVFGGFSAKSLQERIHSASAKLVITADVQCRGGKRIPLKPAVDEGIALGGCESVSRIIVYQRGAAVSNADSDSSSGCAMQAGRDLWWSDAVQGQADVCAPEWVEASHPLFLLYTSGSTGKPKGVQHGSAGYLLHSLLTMKWSFDLQPEDVFWCTADIGWVTGHSYIAYGPTACAATQVIFEGIPTWPDAGRFWQMIERHKVSIFYTAPTAIRSLIKLGPALPGNYDLSSLRLLGSVGEPINPEAWMWYYTQVGGSRCPLLDTFWQTETGAHMIVPLPGVTPLVPGSCTLPFPGIEAAVVDEHGHELPWGEGGSLVIKRPWPGMLTTLWNEPQRYINAYFPAELGGRLYLAGDGAVRDAKTGYFTIMGRIDDVLNVSGHRLGTMEIESALVANPLVAEAAVVGRPDELTGEAICAFVVLKGERPTGAAAVAMANDLRDWVGQEIGPIAKPRDIRFGDNLPKTRSGKIMRRLLRQLAKGEELTQDVTTLENPAILEQLRAL